jgi:hypothetical protein
VEQLLEAQRAGISPGELRQMRAVMVLEWVGDAAAKDLLQRWAGGPAGARLTTEAAAALQRLQASLPRQRGEEGRRPSSPR